MSDFLPSTSRLFRPIDFQSARLLARIDQGQCPELPLLTALTSWAAGQGHTCLPLAAAAALLAEAGLDPSPLRDLAGLRTRLAASPAVGRPGEARPLVFDDNDLALFRLYRDETTIAQTLRQRAAVTDTLPATVASLLEQLFPAADTATVDWQRAAAVLALCKPLVIIAGGPGTGKTHTAARILALHTAVASKPLRIALAAPTGKAALRLREAMCAARESLPAAFAAGIPEQAQTLHRLLGFQTQRPGFLHHAANPLHLDLLIIDEASMIDVPLMAATLAALPDSCRLILLGDRDQLASVEAGNLFGDLCGDGSVGWSPALTDSLRPLLGPITQAGVSSHPLADSLVMLRDSRRFQAQSGIGALARAINSGESAALATVLDQPASDLTIEEAAMTSGQLQQLLEPWILPVATADSPRTALAFLSSRRILCALREGPAGVGGINRLAATLLRRRGIIAPGEQCYRGMPILILRNDYALGLFNGDTGVLWPDDHDSLHAWFPTEHGELRPVGLARLPAWQTSYALTVHKAQGSEFDRVLLLLPSEDAPVLSRELLYTGLTRARTHLTLCGCRELLVRVVARRVIRFSGLGRKLGDTAAAI